MRERSQVETNNAAIMTKYVNNDLNLDFNKVSEGRTNKRVEGIIGPEKLNNVNIANLKTIIVSPEVTGVMGLGFGVHELGLESGTEGNVDTGLYFDERIKVLNGHIEMLHEQYSSNERNFQLECLDIVTKNDEVQEKTMKNDRLICELNKEIIKQRVQFEQYEFEIQNENEHLRRDNVAKANRLAQLEVTAEKERREIENAIEKQANQFSAKYKEKCREKESETEKVKKRYKDMQEIHFLKVKELDEGLRKLRDKYQEVRVKKDSELAVYRAELGNLKEQYKLVVGDMVLEGLIDDRDKEECFRRLNEALRGRKPRTNVKPVKRLRPDSATDNFKSKKKN